MQPKTQNSGFQKKLDYFHLPTIERLVRTLCHRDNERIRSVIFFAKLLEHPYVQALRTIIREHKFQATEKHIRGIVLREKGFDPYILEICAWHAELQNKVRFALAALERKSTLAGTPKIHLLKMLADAFCLLQERAGFLMFLPQELSADMVELVLSGKK